MTVALLVSHADPASVNISERLREMVPWNVTDDHVRGLPVHSADGDRLIMFQSPTMHLDCDLIDKDLEEATGLDIEAVLVLSKHKAASGSSALTVHPIGNWNDAEFGGKPKTLTPAAPALSARLLRALAAEAKAERISHAVTYEATHHGPFLETPAAFVEIGTDEEAWRDPRLGAVVARAVLEAASGGAVLADEGEPVLIAVGGSHYAPRATDLARKRRVAFGHILPGYQVDVGVDAAVVRQAVERTPRVEGFLLDERGLKGDATPVVATLEEAGLARVAPDELRPRA